MKTKWLAIIIILLFSGASIPTYAHSDSKTSLPASNVNIQITRPFKVIGFGNIYGFYVNNVSIHLRGFVYADIFIINWESLPPGWGQHFIMYDTEEREFFTAKTLPLYFLLINFRGYVNSKPYYTPHGPFGCGYRILGSAENIVEIYDLFNARLPLQLSKRGNNMNLFPL